MLKSDFEGLNPTQFQVVGVNWRTASLEIRERVARTAEVVRDDPDFYRLFPTGTEMVLLSTCNRLELYLVFATEIPLSMLPFFQGIEEELIYHHKGDLALRHLFMVAAGLDSMILGENQIFSQLKEAYSKAVSSSMTSLILNRVFHMAFSISKKIHTHTTISHGNISYAGVALKRVQQTFPDQKKIRVFLLGAGEIAATVAESFTRAEGIDLTIYSRSLESAEGLAARFNRQSQALTELLANLKNVDVLIGGLSVTSPFLSKSELQPIFKQGRTIPLLLIDLSVPRNFSSDIADLSQVQVVNLDDFESEINAAFVNRQSAINDAEQFITEGMDKIHLWFVQMGGSEVYGRISERIRVVVGKCFAQHARHCLPPKIDEVKKLHRALMKLLLGRVGLESRGLSKQEKEEFHQRIHTLYCGTDRELNDSTDRYFHSQRMEEMVYSRFLLFLKRNCPTKEIIPIAKELSHSFVNILLTPLNGIYASAVCPGYRKKLEEDFTRCLPR